jgi:hypothetical protein
MRISSHGSSIDREVIKDGLILDHFDCTIDVQICKSGISSCKGKSIVKKRYIPPGSTCVINDGPDVTVLETIYDEEPAAAAAGPIVMGGMKVTMAGSGISTMSGGSIVNMSFGNKAGKAKKKKKKKKTFP